MQSRKLQTGKLNISSMQTPRIIIARSYDRFPRKTQFIKGNKHGILRGRSCLTNLLEYTEIISKWLDDGSPVDVIYLDFQKVSDKFPHQRLLIKLKSHGMGVNIVTSTKLANRQKAKGMCGRGNISMDCSCCNKENARSFPCLFIDTRPGGAQCHFAVTKLEDILSQKTKHRENDGLQP